VLSDTIHLVLGPDGPLVSTSPVVTVEPRRRRFHAPINLTIPAPESTVSKQGRPTKDGSKLHLLYSVTGTVANCCFFVGKVESQHSKTEVEFLVTLLFSFMLSCLYYRIVICDFYRKFKL